mgnify:CR=1 FL=1|jgi:hypothetical protein
MNDKYENLANAIVLQAVKDYRSALKKLKKYPCHKESEYTKREVERFIRSGWYSCLTSIDGEMLIAKLREEGQNDSQRVFRKSL